MGKPHPIFKGTIKNGKLVIHDREEFDIYLYTFEDGDELVIDVRKPKNKRTLKQNSYLWAGVYKTISDYTGHPPQELHDFFKAKFLQKRTEILGKTYVVIRSTTDLTTKEFGEYILNIKRWAATTIDCFVPDANKISLPTYF